MRQAVESVADREKFGLRLSLILTMLLIELASADRPRPPNVPRSQETKEWRKLESAVRRIRTQFHKTVFVLLGDLEKPRPRIDDLPDIVFFLR
jgi:hypothetical protein